jgi:hypothetical protein
MKIKKGNNYECIKDGTFKCNDFNNVVVTKGTVLYCESDGILVLNDGRRIAYSGNAGEHFVKYETPEEIRHWKDVRERAAISALPASIEWVGSLLKQGAKAEHDTIQGEIAAFAVRLADALVAELKND